MARQNINTGSVANDGTGDTLRQAGQKINDNFVEIYNQLAGDSNSLSSQITIETAAIAFEGSSNNDFETRLSVVNPTADRAIELPNAAGTVVLDAATQTLTNKTLTTPTLSTPTITTAINGAGGDEIIEFDDQGASSVNHIKVSNATTGNPAEIEAAGDDTNINLSIFGKGTGSVALKTTAYTAAEMTANGNVPTSVSYIIGNKGTALAATLLDGTTQGEYKIFTNKGAGAMTVTPTNFAQGTSFALAQFDGCTCIWDSDNWYLIGNQGEVTIA